MVDRLTGRRPIIDWAPGRRREAAIEQRATPTTRRRTGPSMLIDFFYSLRAAKLPVSVKEYLTLLDALKANVIAPSLDEFYYLARMTLVKDEQYFDKFDQAFGAYFNGVAQASELAFDVPLDWLKKKLLPKLRRGDVLVMDNLRAHHDRRVEPTCAAFGVRLVYQPPHSPDMNPIEPSWALQKQFVRKHAPRSPQELRRLARRARYRVTPRHCRSWFSHAGYGIDSGDLWG